jgi:sodium-dependent dicarboxylate transporter 2/3/5
MSPEPLPAPAAPEERSGPRGRRLGLALGLALFGVLLSAPGIPLEPAQRKVAAVTALTAVLWVSLALPIGATSLLPAVLFPVLGVMPATEVAPRYMQDLVLLFLGAFVIALGVERWGLHRRMALAIISRIGTRPRRLVLGFMCASAFLSLWINNTATTLLMLPIAMAVVATVREQLGASDPEHRFQLCLLLGTAYSASMGGTGTPVGTAPNQILLGIYATSFPRAPEIHFGEWCAGWLPFVLLFVPCAWLLLTRVLLPLPPVAAEAADTIERERLAMGPPGRGERRMAVVFGATALLWLTRGDLDLGALRVPGWSRLLGASGGGVTDATVALAMALLCFAIPVERGRGVWLMDWRTAARVPWDVLLLFGAGFSIAHAFQTSGLDVTLGRLAAPWLQGLSTWGIVFGTVLFLSFLTELTSNTATTAVLLPVGASAAVESGLHPLLVMAPLAIAASAAFMLPVATPPNAVVFATGYVTPQRMARVGFWINLLTVVLITLVFQLWVRRVWRIGEGLPGWAA